MTEQAEISSRQRLESDFDGKGNPMIAVVAPTDRDGPAVTTAYFSKKHKSYKTNSAINVYWEL